jgi:alkaline phosphatase
MRRFLILFLFILFSSYGFSQDDYKISTNPEIKQYINTNYHEVEIFEEPSGNSTPKNVILLIGDGMGVSQIFAGMVANQGSLYMLNFKNIGFITTHSASHFVTDSGAGGTALATGKKTFNGAIGVDVDSMKIENIREKAQKKGFSTGVVSTSEITHATPASFVAHQPNRNWHEAIASDFISSGIDVFIGGGLRHFNNRQDSIDLTLKLKDNGYSVISGIDQIKEVKEGKLAGFTSDDDNLSKIKGRGNELPIATETAINILSKNAKGFFLMIEGSQIDWGCHQNNTSYIITETLDFDLAVGSALKFAATNKETLVIVTADHETSGFSVNDGSYEKSEVIGGFTSDDHTGVMVPVMAFGPGAEHFRGFHDNTDIPKIIAKIAGYE